MTTNKTKSVLEKFSKPVIYGGNFLAGVLSENILGNAPAAISYALLDLAGQLGKDNKYVEFGMGVAKAGGALVHLGKMGYNLFSSLAGTPADLVDATFDASMMYQLGTDAKVHFKNAKEKGFSLENVVQNVKKKISTSNKPSKTVEENVSQENNGMVSPDQLAQNAKNYKSQGPDARFKPVEDTPSRTVEFDLKDNSRKPLGFDYSNKQK